MATTKTFEVVNLTVDGHVATIAMNRPDRLNAMNATLRRDLNAAFDEVEASDDIWAVILTGEGRAFCAGADVTQMAQARPDDSPRQSASGGESEGMMSRYAQPSLPIRIRELPQPVIGAINGVAVGMGLSIALSCDLRVASDQARFASIFIKRSIMPDNGATFLLPTQVGPGIAAEMTLTGNIYDANWALEKGLVNKVVSHEKLLEEARAYAETIAGNPPIGVRLTKRLLYKTNLSALQQAIDNENNYNRQTDDTEDKKEAIRAFLEKRQPAFKGR